MHRTSFGFILSLAATAALAQGQIPDHVPGRLIVQTTTNANPLVVARALAGRGAAVHHNINQIRASVLNVPEAAADGIMRSLQATGLFTYVERDHYARPATTPNDPDFPSQWHLSKIQAPSGWNMTTGSSTPIAIIDSGVDLTQPDLASKVAAGWNFVTGTSNTQDLSGHGTNVAGAAAAITNNLQGVAGVAWNNPIMPLVVINSSNWAYYSDIASAINWAADHGARILNISIAGTSSSSTLQSAVDYAWNKGAVVFAAAGNYASSSPTYPAACNNVVAVSATTSSDTLSSYSSYGSWITVAAPGDSILSTALGGGYGYYSGTSLASPVAAGVGALIFAANPSLSASSMVSILDKNADDIGASGYDPSFGWGRVNAYKAVSAAKGTSSSDTTPPSVSITTPGGGATVSGIISVQGTATDNMGVTRIECWAGNTLVSTATTSPFNFSWNSATVANGSITLIVKASDAANNSGSASVSVNVSNSSGITAADTTPPVVAVTSPLNGGTVSRTTAITVSATDNVGVTQVSIYIDGVQVVTDTSSPYTYSWNTRKYASGSHTIAAKGWDAAGNVGSSLVVTVNVTK